VSVMRVLRRLLLLATLVAVAASATPFTLTSTVVQSGWSGLLPFDPQCDPGDGAPCVAGHTLNMNLQVFNITLPNAVDFTSDPRYRDVWVINSMTLTFTMTGLDTTGAPFLDNERIWFPAGTGVRANGFTAIVTTKTIPIPAGNPAFVSIANTVRSTGKLSAQLRNAANVPGTNIVSLPSSSFATVTINADTPEPSTMATFGIGFGAIFLLALRRKR
jgi:hypothetical protein